MFTISGGNTFGCLAIPTESELPVSMSFRTSPRTRASSAFSVCSVRMDRARSSDNPLLIIVANCREKTARSLSLTFFFPRPGRVSSLLIPALVCVMLRGAYPIPLSFEATWAWVSASSLPLLSWPDLSRTLYSNVAVAVAISQSPLSLGRRAG